LDAFPTKYPEFVRTQGELVIDPKDPTEPLLMVLMVTGVVVDGTTARFSVPVMPGPLIKKAKACTILPFKPMI
jgi:hypothetical protein